MQRLRPFKLLKIVLPKSLFGRFVLILLVPLLLLQIVLGYIFFDRHTETILRQLSSTIAGDIALVDEMVNEQKPIKHIKGIALKNLQLEISFDAKGKLQKYGPFKGSWLYMHMSAAIEEHVKKPYFLKMNKETIFIDIETNKGVLSIKTPRKRLFSRTTPLVIIWTTSSAILLFFIAVIFMRNQIRPIRRLAEIAEKFGKGHDTQDFRPEGAFEVRIAGQAFNQMQKRLCTHIEERTRMLAGVSHDLRTPLTRMKLQLALMPHDNNVKNLQEDVDEMQQMVQGFLDFAKGIQNEKLTTIELNAAVEAIISGFKEAHPMSISFAHKKDLWIDIKKSIFNRCLTNLLLNSYKYANTVQIQILAEPHQAIIIIDDDGVGIPEEKREIVFQPFFRLDPARNSETGGVGLGLSIVRDAIHHHGGTIQLLQSPLGGLRVYITLPR